MKSSLFMMEQIIVILIFAVCATVCVEMFAASFIMAAESRDMNNALIIAECAAECHKAAAGDAERTALVLGGYVDEDGVVSVYYDENRQLCAESLAVYIMNIAYKSPADVPAVLVFGDISVAKAGGEQILAFTSAARRSSQ